MPKHPRDTDDEESSHDSNHNTLMGDFEPIDPMGSGGENGFGIDFEMTDPIADSSGSDQTPEKRPASAESFAMAEAAQMRARELGLSGIHSHETMRGTMYMPGRTHSKLNKALEKRDRRPVKMPRR